jgi:hypothetical protein
LHWYDNNVVDFTTNHGLVTMNRITEVKYQESSVELVIKYGKHIADTTLIISRDLIHPTSGGEVHTTPLRVKHISCKYGSTSKLHALWWTGVSTSYILRPNPSTHRKIQEMSSPELTRTGGDCVFIDMMLVRIRTLCSLLVHIRTVCSLI